MMSSFNAPKVLIDCHDSLCFENISSERRKSILNKITSLDIQVFSNVWQLYLKIYDVTVNLDLEDGQNNGSLCIAKYIEHKQHDTSRPSIIWVQFEDIKIGQNRRDKYKRKGFYHEGINPSWTSISDVERTIVYLSKYTIRNIQFPLQPSAGRTVYRAQGTTVDELVIGLSQKVVRQKAHLHYVALIRVRSIKNLYILNFNKKALKVDEKVVQEMQRLCESKLQLWYIPFDTDAFHGLFNILFNYCRS